jgi:hypothetical protein
MECATLEYATPEFATPEFATSEILNIVFAKSRAAGHLSLDLPNCRSARTYAA